MSEHEANDPEHEAPEDSAALADPPAAPPPAAVAPVVVPRWVQLVALPLAVLGLYSLLKAAGAVLLLFVIASLIALLLNPFVSLVRRTGLPRGLSVLVVFLVLITIVGGVVALVSNPIADQISSIQKNVPKYVDDANHALANVQRFFDDKGIHVQIASQGRTALQTLGDRLSKGSGSIVRFTRDALTKLVEASLAVILVVALTVYMLLYGERIGVLVRRAIPRGDGSPEDDFPTRIQQAVLGYVRGQLLFSLIMGTSAGVMLFALGALGIFPDGRTYALAFGAFYGFAELIPYIGPAIGGAPPVFAAFLGSHPIDGVWVTVAFIALQQLEGHVVAPNVFAQALRINPILVIFALLMGAQLYGVIGAFIALPTAAMLRETVVYFRRHLVLEPWPRTALAGVGTGIEISGPDRCPECGATVQRGDVVCTRCGTELSDDAARTAAASSAPG
jgi:predicted PurR-regulated permease PerM